MARIIISGKRIVRETRTDKIAIHGKRIYRETIPAAAGSIPIFMYHYMHHIKK